MDVQRWESPKHWARSFDRSMPAWAPSVRCAKLMPSIVSPEQKCRRCRVAHSNYRDTVEKLMYSVAEHFLAANAAEGTLSMCIVTPDGPVWRGVTALLGLERSADHLYYGQMVISNYNACDKGLRLLMKKLSF